MIFFTIVISITWEFYNTGNHPEILDSKINFKMESLTSNSMHASMPPKAVLNILSNHKYLPQLNKHIKSVLKNQRKENYKTLQVGEMYTKLLFDLDFEEIMFLANGIKLGIIGDGSGFHSGRSKWS